MVLPWIAEADIENMDAKGWKQQFTVWRSKRSTLLLICSLLASAVLSLNIAVGMIYERKKTNSVRHDLREAYAGSCETSRQLNAAVHVIINVLSTILLSGSNVCMQLLAAPTRKEIGRCHQKKKSLDIGVPSIKNLRVIGWRRKLLYGPYRSFRVPCVLGRI